MRPALYMATALAAGIAAADLLRPHPALALVAVLVACLWAAFSRRSGAAALLLVVAAAGALRYSYVQTAGRGDLAAWQGQKVTVIATVVEEPELRQPKGARYAVSVEQVDGHPAAGKLFVQQFSDRTPGFGERVEVRGTLKLPTGPRTPGGFDQAEYLARKGIYLTLDTGEAAQLGPGRLNPLRKAAVAARIRLEAVLKASLPSREAALSAGLLFGSRSDLPDDIKEAFKTSGVFHLLAVSGGNVAMVIMPILGLLRRAGLSKRAASAVAVPVVIFFVFLTGASPSVMRAGLMAMLVLLGDVAGRERNALNTLGAAVLLLLAWSPGLLFDLGFQLSAGATLGILLFARPIEGWLAPRFQAVFGERAGGWLAAGLSVTFAAQAVVEPISLHAFGTWSAIAPLANLLVLGLVEPVVQVGAVATLAGLLWLTAARLLFWPVKLGLWLLVFAAKATAAVPFAFLEVGKLPAPGVIAWYGVVAVAAWPAHRKTLLDGVRRLSSTAGRSGRFATAGALALLVTTGLIWRVALAAPSDMLVISFLDVGQGDAILVQAPGGHAMLVDVGVAIPDDPKSARPGFDAGAEVVVPYLRQAGVRRLDYLVLTHADQDHAGGGAAVLQRVPVGMVLKSGDNAAETGYLRALVVAKERNVPMRDPVAGERFTLGEGVLVEVLSPPRQRFSGTRSDDNSNCIVLRLTYRQIATLLTCDMEAEVEEHLLSQNVNVRADLLKVSHHGSGYSSTAPFLQAVRPKSAVLSAGNGNIYKHPHAATVKRLEDVGAAIYRTDRHGTISARTDGYTLTLTGARGGPEEDRYRPVGLLGRRLVRAW